LRIFVTGAAGFVGSHVVDALLTSGHEVTAMVRYSSNPNVWRLQDSINRGEQSKRLRLVFGDIEDRDWLEREFTNHEIIIHLAALISIPHSYIAPNSHFKVNTNGTINVLEAARKKEVKRVIVTSTSEVYGSAQLDKMPESHPISPQSPYAASKAASDLLVKAYFDSFNLPVVILRPFNVFGPKQSTRAVIPTIINQLLKGDGKLALGDISTSREFNYVKETANAFVSAISAREIEGKVINIGNSVELQIRELLDIMCEIANSYPEIVTDTERIRPNRSEVRRLNSDSSLAKKLLNWEASSKNVEHLKIALEETFIWYRENGSKSPKPIEGLK